MAYREEKEPRVKRLLKRLREIVPKTRLIPYTSNDRQLFVPLSRGVLQAHDNYGAIPFKPEDLWNVYRRPGVDGRKLAEWHDVTDDALVKLVAELAQEPTPTAVRRARAVTRVTLRKLGEKSRWGRVGSVAELYKRLIMDARLNDEQTHAAVVAELGKKKAGPPSYAAWYRSWLKRHGHTPRGPQK